MSFTPYRLVACLVTIQLTLALSRLNAHALDPRFELDPRTLDAKGDVQTKEKRAKDRKKAVRVDGEVSEYTIKSGDHIFKVLMRDYGLSNSEAESLIPEVKRLNDITDIRRLRVGQAIKIPLVRKGSTARTSGSTEKRALHEQPQTTAVAGSAEEKAPSPAGHSLHMMSLPMERESDGVATVRRVWDNLVPAKEGAAAPIEIEDKNFSLSLDPSTFPTFPAADGGKIVVDSTGKLPPLVKALIEGKDPKIRIVSEDPRNRKRFISSMLTNAKFYSVEENFAVNFGADPKLTVNADFKVEKTPESLLHNDVVLVNVGEQLRGMPPSLVQFLHRQGFQIVEPFPPQAEPAAGIRYGLHQIKAKDPRGIVDALLDALSLRFESNRNVEVYGLAESGLKLFVKADRYFEENGERFVVSHFDGDPINYTLTRLLETRGYRVVMLDPKDDFRKISEKFLSRLRIAGNYANHDLISNRDAPYAVQMSGFRLRSSTGPVILTNVEIDPLFRDLLDYNGYNIITH